MVIPVVREKIRVKIGFAIPMGTPMILVNEIINTQPLVTLKTIKILSI